MRNTGRLRLGLLMICLQVLDLRAGIGLGHAQSDSSPKRYPPYPDVWEWMIPKGRAFEPALRVEKRDDGDVQIIYGLRNAKAERGQVNCEQKPWSIGCVTYHKAIFFRGQREPSPGIKLLLPRGDRRLSFADGVTLERIREFGERPRACYNNLDATVVKKDPGGRVVAQKKLFYTLDPPRWYRAREECTDGPSFLNRVDSIFADFLLLEWGTSLTKLTSTPHSLGMGDVFD